MISLDQGNVVLDTEGREGSVEWQNAVHAAAAPYWSMRRNDMVYGTP